MEDEIFHKMFELDEMHWWFYGQRAWLRQFYSRFRKQNKKWLDVGCGVGDILRTLKKDFIVFGIDKNDLAVAYSKKRGISNLVKGEALALPFKDESFDFVSVLGIIYHRGVKDELSCLKESLRVCKREGILFFLEPVTFVKGSHDIKEHAARRYSLRVLRKLILDAGLKIEKITYFYFFVFFPIFFIRKLEQFHLYKKKDTSDLERPNLFINALMVFLITLESIWIRFFSLPIGISIICIARKP